MTGSDHYVSDPSKPEKASLGWRIVDMAIATRQWFHKRIPVRGAAFLVIPGLVCVSLLSVGLVLLAWKSIHSFDPYLFRQGPVSLENYRYIIENDLAKTVFQRTIMMAIITTIVALLVALPLAYVMTRSRSRAVRLLLLVAIFLPILTGDIVRAYGWLVLLGRDGILAWIIGRDPGLLGTLWAVGIGTIQILLPLSVVILLPSFQRVDTTLEKAGATLGASQMRIWTNVILPMVRPGLVGASAICIIIGMTEFANPSLLGQGVRDYVANLVQNVVLGRDNVYLGAAIGLSLLGVVLCAVAAILVLGKVGTNTSHGSNTATGVRG